MVSDPVLIAIIGAFGVVMAALLGYLGITATITRRHARAASNSAAETRDEVKNSHTVNLRDDLDAKFEGLAVLVKSMARDVGGMKADIRGIRTDASDDRRNATEALAAERERILILERTLTPAQLKRLRTTIKEQS